MTVEFKLPELGENVQAGDVVNILVTVGDTVTVDQPVLELETDKATVEVPSSVNGVVQAIHIKSGETVKVGQVILTLETADDERQPAPEPATAQPAAVMPPPAQAQPESPPPPPSESPKLPAQPSSPVSVEFKLPAMGENMQAGTVINVMVEVGDAIVVDQAVLELETDKATVEIPSTVSGVVTAVHLKAGDTARVGQPVLTLETSVLAGEPVSPPPAPPQLQETALPSQPAPVSAATQPPEPPSSFTPQPST